LVASAPPAHSTVLRPGAQSSAEEICAFCHGEIAHYKVPRYVRFLDAFPLTVSGRIRKNVLREQMAQVLAHEETTA
jgi:fatty-acyl-CoA synthase